MLDIQGYFNPGERGALYHQSTESNIHNAGGKVAEQLPQQFVMP